MAEGLSGGGEAAPPSTLSGVEVARKFLAFALFWLVHEGPKKLEAMEALAPNQRRVERFGAAPAIDMSRPVFLPRSSGGVAFKHDGDLAEAGRYHRVWQVLLYLWRAVKLVKGASVEEKWDGYWRKEGLFEGRVVDRKFVPVWMREAESKSEGRSEVLKSES